MASIHHRHPHEHGPPVVVSDIHQPPHHPSFQNGKPKKPRSQQRLNNNNNNNNLLSRTYSCCRYWLGINTTRKSLRFFAIFCVSACILNSFYLSHHYRLVYNDEDAAAQQRISNLDPEQQAFLHSILDDHQQQQPQQQQKDDSQRKLKEQQYASFWQGVSSNSNNKNSNPQLINLLTTTETNQANNQKRKGSGFFKGRIRPVTRVDDWDANVTSAKSTSNDTTNATTSSTNATTSSNDNNNTIVKTSRNDRLRERIARRKSNLQFNEDPLTPLQYAPQRIPGYINVWGNDTRSLYGFVMRDLMTRICSRQITSSNILVVSPDAPTVVQLLHNTTTMLGESDFLETDLQKQIHYTVGGSALIKVHKEGHIYHGLDNTTLLDDWWRSFDKTVPPEDTGFSLFRFLKGTAKQQQPQVSKPTWIMLAMIDHGPKNDDIVRNALSLLKESTVTYIVVGFGAFPDGEGVYGQEAIEHLASLKYKVQLLSLSHMSSMWYHTVSRYYRPNADLTDESRRQTFFSGLKGEASKTGTPVLGYAFATQGLDLAIPTATEYNPIVSPQQHSVLYKQCPKTELSVNFIKNENKLPDMNIACQARTISPYSCEQLWMSGSSLISSEALCVRAECDGNPKQASCVTRIIPKTTPKDERAIAGSEKQKQNQQQPNLLVLMIDPISRQRFERSLVKTNRLIQRLNFTSFSQYTAVGNNSGPNQAALYSGKALQGRDSIATHHEKNGRGQWLWDTLKENGYATLKAEDGCVENSNMIQSIRPQVDHGDSLQEMMCFDFQRPNCVGDTPAAQFLLDYGRQFIQAYARKERPWAAFMHFIDSHEDTMTLQGTLDDKLWKFLYSIYTAGQGGEQCDESETKGRNKKSKRMPCNVWDNTMIVLISDHGLHYGNYLMAPKGLQERSQPMFHIHLPKNTPSSAVQAIEDNKDKWTTPFDVYETILDALVSKEASNYLGFKTLVNPSTATGTSLLQSLPKDRSTCSTTPGIPAYICDILNPAALEKNFMMPNPPSVMSFYADIPNVNKQVPQPCPMFSNTTLFQPYQKCLCATNLRPWHNCSHHPFSPRERLEGDTFALVDCGGNARSYEVKVKSDPNVLKRKEIVSAQSSGASQERPNVIFIELDSVSQAYADRHFPRTRELLNTMRVQKTDHGYTCGTNQTLCAADFKEFSVVGASSIPNQVGALGGCIVMVGPERCNSLEPDSYNRTICTDINHLVYGMELINRHEFSHTFCRVDDLGRSPWLFDTAKAAGYVTLFAEEFCYDGSVYVSQGNVFELDADILPHKFFCRNVERRAQKEGFQIKGPIWKYEDSSNPTTPCIDEAGSYTKQKVAIDHIASMWEAYPDTPKFAFVNAMAAHVYGRFKTMGSAAEAYDLTLVKFLKSMLERPDAKNTIFIVRGDHGLQAGPKTADYSIQTEAYRPWTEIVVPKDLSGGVSLDKLFENQERLATGYDLYRTLSQAISGHDRELVPDYAPWMNHLWQDHIPEERTCSDAMILPAYCIYESTRTITAPNLKTCNMVEPEQRLICPLYSNAFEEELGYSFDDALYTSKIQSKVCPLDSSTATISSTLRHQWDALDDNLAERDNEKPAWGGMELHQRKATILNEVVKELGNKVHRTEQRPLVICETSFGTGHNAALFLDASPYTTVHSFDSFDGPHKQLAVNELKLKYGEERLLTHPGNSWETVKTAIKPIKTTDTDIQCDFLHGLSSHPSDSIDLVKHSPCGVFIVTPPLKTLLELSLYFGPKSQWTHLRKEGCIRDVTCFLDDLPTKQFKNTGRTLGKAAGPSKFCMAVTTGECQQFGRPTAGMTEEECDTTIAKATDRIQLNFLCPIHEAAVPNIVASDKKMTRPPEPKRAIVPKGVASDKKTTKPPEPQITVAPNIVASDKKTTKPPEPQNTTVKTV